MRRSVSSGLEHIHRLVSDPALSALVKIREIRSLSTTSQTLDKILRNSMIDRALLPGEAYPGRAARVPSNVAASLIAFSFLGASTQKMEARH